MPIQNIVLITGHSIRKDAPVLQGSYIHSMPERVRTRQIDVLGRNRPDVGLPVYKRGQFKARLGKDAKVYP